MLKQGPLKSKEISQAIFAYACKKIILMNFSILLQIHTTRETILDTTKRKFRENIPISRRALNW